MKPDRIRILQGSTFVVSDRSGDIDPGTEGGLFYQDMRHLSQWQLLIDGRGPGVLAVETPEYHTAAFFLMEFVGTVYRDATISVIRSRQVVGGMREHLEVINHGTEDTTLQLSLRFAADFADLFEVKGQRVKPSNGEHYLRRQDRTVVLGSRGFLSRDPHLQ